MEFAIGACMGFGLLATNVWAVMALRRARQDPTSPEHLESMIRRCRLGLTAVGLGFFITVGYSLWAILQSMSAETAASELELLASTVSTAIQYCLLLLLGVLVPSGCIIYLNVLLRRSKKRNQLLKVEEGRGEKERDDKDE